MNEDCVKSGWTVNEDCVWGVVGLLLAPIQPKWLNGQ